MRISEEQQAHDGLAAGGEKEDAPMVDEKLLDEALPDGPSMNTPIRSVKRNADFSPDDPRNADTSEAWVGGADDVRDEVDMEPKEITVEEPDEAAMSDGGAQKQSGNSDIEVDTVAQPCGPLISGRARRRLKQHTSGKSDLVGSVGDGYPGTDETARSPCSDRHEFLEVGSVSKPRARDTKKSHPNPRMRGSEIPDDDLAWRDIGSGMVARTFKNAAR